MAKPSLQNITVTQTFQNWFDKTNEVVDIFRDEALTASPGGDTTNGNATLVGNFTATDIIATSTGRFDSIESRNGSDTIAIGSPFEATTTDQTVGTLTHVAAGPQLRFTDNTNTWDVGFKDSTAAFVINTGVGDKFNLSTAGTLTIPNLDVTEGIDGVDFAFSGDGQITGTVLDISANTNITGDLAVTGNFTVVELIANNVTATSDMYCRNLRATGEVVTNYSVSDIKLKENLEVIPDALAKVSNINGYTFNYIGEEERVTGVVAQEIEKVLPGVVFEFEDQVNGNYKAVRYGNIVALLIEAVKELSAEVERLKDGSTD